MIVGQFVGMHVGPATVPSSPGGPASGGPSSGGLSGLLLLCAILVVVIDGSGHIGAMGVNLMH